MAKTIAELERKLTDAITSVMERIDALRRNDVADLITSRDKLAESVHDLRRDAELLKQRLDDHLKRVEKWENRFWGLILLVITLVVGLIVAIVKK